MNCSEAWNESVLPARFSRGVQIFPHDETHQVSWSRRRCACCAGALHAPRRGGNPQRCQSGSLLGSDTELTLFIGSGYCDDHRGGGYRRGLNQYGQSDWEVRELSRDAAKACRQAVRYEARQLGYRDIEIDDDRYVRQIGPRGFFVTLGEVEFEGRRRGLETRVSCEIRRGSVISVEGTLFPTKVNAMAAAGNLLNPGQLQPCPGPDIRGASFPLRQAQLSRPFSLPSPREGVSVCVANFEQIS